MSLQFLSQTKNSTPRRYRASKACLTWRALRSAPRLFARLRGHVFQGSRVSSNEHGERTFPDVSVVMPVHDMPVTLVRRALRSVHRQTYPGVIETILWDDGSRNPYRRGAYAALESWHDNATVPAGHRVIVAHRTQEQRGIARSRNDAVAHAGAEWLLWLDGDDELPPEAISSLVTSGATVRESLRHRSVPCRLSVGCQRGAQQCALSGRVAATAGIPGRPAGPRGVQHPRRARAPRSVPQDRRIRPAASAMPNWWTGSADSFEHCPQPMRSTSSPP